MIIDQKFRFCSIKRYRSKLFSFILIFVSALVCTHFSPVRAAVSDSKTDPETSIDLNKPLPPTLFRLLIYKEFLLKLGKSKEDPSEKSSNKKGKSTGLISQEKLAPLITEINNKIKELEGKSSGGSESKFNQVEYVREWFYHFTLRHSWSMTTLVALPPLITAMSYGLPFVSGIYGVHGLFIFANNMALFAHQQAATMVCSYLVGSALKQTTGVKMTGAAAVMEKALRKLLITSYTKDFFNSFYGDFWQYDDYFFLKAAKETDKWAGWENIFGYDTSQLKEFLKGYSKNIKFIFKPTFSSIKAFLKESGVQVSSIPNIINSYYNGISVVAQGWQAYPEKVVEGARGMYMSLAKGSPLLQLYQFLALSDKQLSSGTHGDTDKLPNYLVSFNGVKEHKPTPGTLAAAVKFRAAMRNAERLVNQSLYYSQAMLDSDKKLFEESLTQETSISSDKNLTNEEVKEIKEALEKDNQEVTQAMKKN